jgi:hypothetical protein
MQLLVRHCAQLVRRLGGRGTLQHRPGHGMGECCHSTSSTLLLLPWYCLTLTPAMRKSSLAAVYVSNGLSTIVSCAFACAFSLSCSHALVFCTSLFCVHGHVSQLTGGVLPHAFEPFLQERSTSGPLNLMHAIDARNRVVLAVCTCVAATS